MTLGTKILKIGWKMNKGSFSDQEVFIIIFLCFNCVNLFSLSNTSYVSQLQQKVFNDTFSEIKHLYSEINNLRVELEKKAISKVRSTHIKINSVRKREEAVGTYKALLVINISSWRHQVLPRLQRIETSGTNSTQNHLCKSGERSQVNS